MQEDAGAVGQSLPRRTELSPDGVVGECLGAPLCGGAPGAEKDVTPDEEEEAEAKVEAEEAIAAGTEGRTSDDPSDACAGDSGTYSGT